MSNADRIEELRKKYEENPRRYFAPLANEFRKAGDLSQAIAICREHLPKQPGHMSGYIVFGQTLFEANSLEEARTVFEQALTLDPENLIALKHLGDIARMNGENSTARRWYARVLDADPRNDDIASQLASLGAPTPAIPVPVVPSPPTQEELDDKPGVFATFDPNALLDLPEDAGQTGTPARGLPFIGTPAMGTPAMGAPVTNAPYDARLEPLDLDFPENPEPASEEFEEGILAPQWPDTTELVARVQTPIRSATPLGTPAVPASAETVQAFGRESSDPADLPLLDIPLADGLVDAFLPTDQQAPAAGDANDFVSELDATEFESAEFDSSIVEAHEFDTPLAEVEHEIPVTAQSETASLLDLDETPMPWDVAAERENAAPDAQVMDESVAQQSHVDITEPEVEQAPEQLDEFLAQPVSDALAEPVAEFASEAALPDTVFEVVAEQQPEIEAAAEEHDEVHSEAQVAPSVEQPVEPDAEELDDLLIDVTAQDTQEFAIAGDWSLVPDSQQPPAVEELEIAGERWEVPEVIEDVAPIVHTFDADLALPEESFAEVSSEVASEREDADAAAAALLASEIENESPTSVAAPADESEAPTFVTETMAELLLSQGHVSRAIEVYDELVRRRPNDVVLVARLQELRETERAESQRSETLRAELQRPDASTAHAPSVPTPALGSAAITPLYSSPVRATPAFTPQQASASGSFNAHSNSQQAFRTARERFAELASRRVARRTPTHATAVADDQAEGLSTLFGTSQPATTDELAARALAEAFGPVQDSGESLFDPAPMPTPALPLRALTPRGVSPIAAPAATNADQRSDRQPASDYSFDKFFPDPAMSSRDAQPAHSSAASTQDPTQPVNEDLAQFSAWLKGLNNA